MDKIEKKVVKSTLVDNLNRKLDIQKVKVEGNKNFFWWIKIKVVKK